MIWGKTDVVRNRNMITKNPKNQSLDRGGNRRRSYYESRLMGKVEGVLEMVVIDKIFTASVGNVVCEDEMELVKLVLRHQSSILVIRREI